MNVMKSFNQGSIAMAILLCTEVEKLDCLLKDVVNYDAWFLQKYHRAHVGSSKSVLIFGGSNMDAAAILEDPDNIGCKWCIRVSYSLIQVHLPLLSPFCIFCVSLSAPSPIFSPLNVHSKLHSYAGIFVTLTYAPCRKISSPMKTVAWKHFIK